MIPLFEPRLLIENLAIIFVFILFTLRAFWNAFVNKSDPINTIKLSWLERKLTAAEHKKKLNEIS